MSDLIKSFSVNDIQLYKDDENVDFAIAEIYALADHSNSHKNPISTEVLKEYADTFLGKFVVAKYDKWTKDVTTHVPDEVVIGYIDPRQKVRFKTKVVNGEEKTFVVVYATLSKLYATDIVEMFRKDNNRSVSCEFSCQTMYEEDENGVPLAEFGTPMYGEENPILAYSIHGITVLGLKVNPSVAGAEMQIKKFAEEAQLVSHPMHKDEYVDVDWDGEKAKHDAIKEKDFDTMAKSIFLKLDSDYKDRKVGSLHYPVMGLYSGVWKYNKNGLSSARAYGEQHDKDVAEKAIRIQKKLGLYEEPSNKEDKMQDEKKFESEQDDIIMSEDEKEMSAKTLGCKGEESMAEEVEEVKVEETEEQKELSEDVEMSAKEDEETRHEDEEDERDVEEEVDDKEDEDEKEFSLDLYLSATTEEMFSEEEDKALAEKVCSMSADEILNTVLTLSKEVTTLKEFKQNADNKEKEMKLSAIMESVRSDLDEKKFAELEQEGKGLSLDELGGFENKVKAFAYECSKKNPKQEQNDIMKFAGITEDNGKKVKTAEDIFNEYL